MELQVKAFLETLSDGLYGSIDTKAMDVNFTPKQLAAIKESGYRVEIHLADGSLYGVYNIANGICINYNRRMRDEFELSILALLGITI